MSAAINHPLLKLPPNIVWNYIAGELLDLNDIAMFEISLAKSALVHGLNEFKDFDWNHNKCVRPERVVKLNGIKADWLIKRRIIVKDFEWIGSYEHLLEFVRVWGLHCRSLTANLVSLKQLKEILDHCPNIEAIDCKTCNGEEMIPYHLNSLTQLLSPLSPNLRYLKYNNVSRPVAISPLDFFDVGEALKQWRNMEHLEINFCILNDKTVDGSSLRHISIPEYINVDTYISKKLFTFPLLLSNIAQVAKNLESLSTSLISEANLVFLARNLPKLKILSFRTNYLYPVLRELSVYCKDLSCLTFEHFKFSPEDINQSLFHVSFNKLKTIKACFIGEEFSRGTQCWTALLARCPALRELEIHEKNHKIHLFDDSLLLSVSQYLINLTTLSLTDKPVCEIGLEALTAHCNNLTNLSLYFRATSSKLLSEFTQSNQHLSLLSLYCEDDYFDIAIECLCRGHASLSSFSVDSTKGESTVMEEICLAKSDTMSREDCAKSLNLRTLKIISSRAPTDWSMINECAPNIQHLYLSSSDSLVHGTEVLQFRNLVSFDAEVPCCRQLCNFLIEGHPTLRSLSITLNNERSNIVSANSLVRNKFLNLYSLTLIGAVIDDDAKLIAASCPKLHNLKIKKSNYLTSKGLIALANGCSRLSKISLSSCDVICMKGLTALVEKLPNLRIADLTNCRKLRRFKKMR